MHRLSIIPVGLLAILAPPMLLLAGCESQPRAPALRDSPVFHSPQEGFRFLVPEGWKQTAHGVLPPGKLKREVLFAQYRLPTSEQVALFELLCYADESHASPQEYHAGPSHGVRRWNSTADPERFELNRASALRLLFSAKIGEQPMVKEVVAFSRKERVYSFIGLYAESDHAAQQELRRAMNSIVWE